MNKHNHSRIADAPEDPDRAVWLLSARCRRSATTTTSRASTTWGEEGDWAKGVEIGKNMLYLLLLILFDS